MEALLVKATTLPDAWFQLVYALMKGDTPRNVYTIDKGSYVGQKRLEFQYITVQIDQPGIRPLIPDIPPMLNIPPPVESMDYVEEYFTRYLMSTELAENETYIYGTWLAPGVERVIEQLRGAPGNNQACVSLGGWGPTIHRPDVNQPAFLCATERISAESVQKLKDFFCYMDENSGRVEIILPTTIDPFVDTDNCIDPGTGQRDPACLRLVDFRLDQDNTLHMCVYFRSWDLWGGLPANLAGLQLVKEYVGQELGAKDGKIIASSKGLHIYDHAIEIAATRLGMSEIGSIGDLVAWIGQGKSK